MAGLVGIAYLWTVNFAFLSDDIFGIVNNPEIFKLSWVGQNPTVILNRLIYFSVANIFGIVSWPFRLVNIFVHLLTVIGVMVLVDKLINKRVGLVAAVLVAIHPIMIESVTWISGNGYSWYGSLLVWSLIFYIRADKSWQRWLISLALFLGALQFSEKAAVLPGLLLAYRLAVDRKRGRWWDLIPYVALSGLWLVMNIRGVGARLNYLETEYNSGGGKPAVRISPLVQVPVALSNYLGLIVWPDKLTLYHSELDMPRTTYRLVVSLTAVYFLATAWLLWRRSLIGFFLSWLVIGLSPTLVPLGVAWIVAERYAYFGVIGIFILVAWGLVRLSEKPKWAEAAWILTTLIICLLFIRTLVRNSDWQDQDHLWLAAERTSPSSPQNHNNLGDLYGRRREFKQAEWHFKKAIELNPVYGDAMHNLGNTYVQMGEFEEAIKWYESALKNKPSLWQSEAQIKAVREYLKGL